MLHRIIPAVLRRAPIGDHVLIHGFATLSAVIGGGLAQLPSTDAAMLGSLQATMVLALAERRGVPMHRTAAAELVLTLGAAVVGRIAARRVSRLVPGWGNAANAMTAASVTEAVGWAAVAWFDREER